ncbi:hypothetical protein C8E03_108167 [Lachnotalea glycerini]|uniref:Uncharacterized protein n=1 Tax=Lachnotalea glycerini TaxID=1763509 RepID=A0A318EQR6_9FIRM|nr:hypothetical protein [Lachnotalea glycerini]PXV88440.1 hypothetical protein C8E03_108167 [Lachnotalea glycerini]
MKTEYEFTENQKSRLAFLYSTRDLFFSELQKAYYTEGKDNNFEYIKLLNEKLMLVSAEITEIYVLAPTRCLMTKEEYESFTKLKMVKGYKKL